MEIQWFTYREGKTEGPFSLHELKHKIEKGKLKGDDYVWNSGYTEWVKVEQEPELSALPFMPPPPPSNIIIPPPPSPGMSVPTQRPQNPPYPVPPPYSGEGDENKARMFAHPPSLPVSGKPESEPPPRSKARFLTLPAVFLLLIALAVYFIYPLFQSQADDPLAQVNGPGIISNNDLLNAEEHVINDDDSGSENGYISGPADGAIQGLAGLLNHPLVDYIGMSSEEIIALFGEPEDVGYWKGSDYYDYTFSRELLFYFGQGIPGEVTGLTYVGEDPVVGVKVGMAMEEVRLILGEPDFEGYDYSYTPPEFSYYFWFGEVELPRLNRLVSLELIIYSYSPDDEVSYIDIISY